jgi:uncharacterized membrane protein YraQ (UPF0718 family)
MLLWLTATGAVQTWSTIFVALFLQAIPFLALGTVLSGAIAAFLPAEWLAGKLPRRPLVAVPVATLAGVALPGCECGSVPIAGRLVDRGVMPSAALAFLLSAPAINPVVLVSTAIAFPGRPQMVLARFVASAVTATVVGLVWSMLTKRDVLPFRSRFAAVPVDGSRWDRFQSATAHDFLHAGGFLVAGAGVAASLHVFLPQSVMDGLGSSPVVGVVVMALLAFVLAVCSEADAFVAASFARFSPTAQLAFMVVGPAVDVKLVAMQVGTFGRRFALRFAPLTFAVALITAVLVGAVLG